MSRFAHLIEALPPATGARGGPDTPTILSAAEHEDLDLPADLIRPDGTLDLYREVERLLEVRYARRRQGFVIRSNGWIGHIPLNPSHVLRVTTRVPVTSLERVVARAAAGRAVQVLTSYERRYAEAEDRPGSFLDVLTDSFLVALREIRRDGLLKSYTQREREGSSPSGRLDPFRSMLRTRLAGRPVAVSSAFERTTDCTANRILLLALRRLRRHYAASAPVRSPRLLELTGAEGLFEGVSIASSTEANAEELGRQLHRLPFHRAAYVDALSLAGYVVADLSLGLLGTEGIAAAPSILVRVDDVFESYARNVLHSSLGLFCAVLDGNRSGPGGAIRRLFTDLPADQPSEAEAKPDIVIEVDGKVRLIIDVKYMPASAVPGRDVINQLSCYAARYGCSRVMALYPSMPAGRTTAVEWVGSIGALQLYRGSLDLGADDLSSSEAAFCRGVRGLISD